MKEWRGREEGKKEGGEETESLERNGKCCEEKDEQSKGRYEQERERKPVLNKRVSFERNL